MSKHLSLLVITILCMLYQIRASPNEVQNKFRGKEIAPDVLEDIPELKALKISYPSGVSVDLGNVLTPRYGSKRPAKR